MVTHQGFDTWADLIFLNMLNFDIILGINWLALHHVVLDCYSKTVTLAMLGMSPIDWKGFVSWVPIGIISYIEAQRLISIGCLAYLSHVWDVTIEATTMELVPIVCEFFDMFPMNLLGLALERDFDFVIKVELGSKPISVFPYWVAPTELKELSTQH